MNRGGFIKWVFHFACLGTEISTLPLHESYVVISVKDAYWYTYNTFYKCLQPAQRSKMHVLFSRYLPFYLLFLYYHYHYYLLLLFDADPCADCLILPVISSRLVLCNNSIHPHCTVLRSLFDLSCKCGFLWFYHIVFRKSFCFSKTGLSPENCCCVSERLI